MKTVTFTEFRRRASGLITEVENGETLVILRHGHAVAEILPVSDSTKRTPSWKRPGLRLAVTGATLSEAILEEREGSH